MSTFYIKDGELYHWKYIKREKVNGKWRYYYKDDDVDKARDELNAARKKREFASKYRDEVIAYNSKQIKKNNEEHDAKYKDVVERDKNWPELFDKNKNYIESANKAKGYSQEAAEKLSAAESKYKSVKKKYDVSAGHKVADLLNSASDAIDKGKKYVTNLLSNKKKKKK